MTFCLVDLLRRHLFLSFYNASPLLSTFFLISPAYWYLVAQLVGKGTDLLSRGLKPQGFMVRIDNNIRGDRFIDLPEGGDTGTV